MRVAALVVTALCVGAEQNFQKMGAFGAPVSAADFPQKAGILGFGRRRCPTRLALVARCILSGREQTGKGYASKGEQGEEESGIMVAVMAE